MTLEELEADLLATRALGGSSGATGAGGEGGAGGSGLAVDEQAILLALSAVCRATRSCEEQLVVLVEREKARRLSAFLAVEDYNRKRREGEEAHQIRPDVWDKTPEQDELETRRRTLKVVMQKCVNALCENALYGESYFQAVASNDTTSQEALRRPGQAAVDQADLFAGLASVPNDFARRAFLLRYKHGRSDEEIARYLNTTRASVARLVNIALGHILAVFNEAEVAKIRNRTMQFCLDNGLEFPEYANFRLA